MLDTILARLHDKGVFGTLALVAITSLGLPSYSEAAILPILIIAERTGRRCRRALRQLPVSLRRLAAPQYR